jgi:hypothetical protein
MGIPVTSSGGAGALHEAVRKHPEYAFILEYGFILALVCLLLGLVWAMQTFVPQAVGAAMNSGASWFVN